MFTKVDLLTNFNQRLIPTGLAVRKEFGKIEVLIKRTWVSLVVPFKDDK